MRGDVAAKTAGAYPSDLLEATNAHADRAAVRRMAGCHARAEAIIEGLPVLVAFVYPVLMPVERVGARRSPVLAAAERLRETALKVTHVRVFVNSPERRAPRENHQRAPAPDPSERIGRDATFEVCLAVPLSPLHRYWHDRRGLLRRRGHCSLRNNHGFLHLLSDDITLHDLFPFVHLHFYCGRWWLMGCCQKGAACFFAQNALLFCAGHDLVGTIPIDHGRLPVKSAPRASSCWFQAPGALEMLSLFFAPPPAFIEPKNKKEGSDYRAQYREVAEFDRARTGDLRQASFMEKGIRPAL